MTTTTTGRMGSSARVRTVDQLDEPSRPVIERDDEFVEEDGGGEPEDSPLTPSSGRRGGRIRGLSRVRFENFDREHERPFKLVLSEE